MSGIPPLYGTFRAVDQGGPAFVAFFPSLERCRTAASR